MLEIELFIEFINPHPASFSSNIFLQLFFRKNNTFKKDLEGA